MTGITIDNKQSLIDAGDNRIVKLADKGAVRIGNGHYLSGTRSIEIAPKPEYEGCLRYNSETQTLEIATASEWKPLGGQLTTDDTMIWGMIF
jgi:hypothetical protein